MEPTLSIDRVLNRVWAIFKSKFWRLVGTTALFLVSLAVVAAVWTIPVSLLSGGAQIAVGVILGILAVIAFLAAIYGFQGSVIRIVEAEEWGRPTGSVMEVFNSVKGRIPAMVGVSIVATIAIFVGFLVFVIPGVVLSILWAVFLPVIVIEGIGMDSLSRSRSLVRGNAFGVLGLHLTFMALAYALMLVLMLLVFAVAAIFGALGGSNAAAVIMVVMYAVGPLIVLPIGSVITAVVYFELARLDYGRRQAATVAPPAPEAPTAPQPA